MVQNAFKFSGAYLTGQDGFDHLCSQSSTFVTGGFLFTCKRDFDNQMFDFDSSLMHRKSAFLLLDVE